MKANEIKACAVFPERDSERVAQLVPCPKKRCSAKVGKQCHRKGQPLNWPHGIRLQAAVTFIVCKFLERKR